MIIRETAEEYHKRPAVSASLLWNIVKPDGCLAQARHDSRWLNPDYEEPRNHDLDFGTLAHLAILENKLLADRIAIIPATNWRTKESQQWRDEAYIANKIPILQERTRFTAHTSYTYQDLIDVRNAVQMSDAAEYFFKGGESEVGYTWEIPNLTIINSESRDDGFSAKIKDIPIQAKARADRSVPTIIGHKLVDLKTANSSSRAAFRRSMLRDGHHLRAAWYLDGWAQQDGIIADYLFVVVAKEKPHIVSVFRCDERAIEWGRRLYKRGLALLQRAQETGVWSGFNDEKIATVSLPGFAEWDYADMERAGEL